MQDALNLSLAAAAERHSAKELSPVTLAEAALARIEATEPVLNAYALITADLAMAAARQAETEIAAGRYLGPLHGIPVAVKDLYDMAGLPTSCSSEVRHDHVAEADFGLRRAPQGGRCCHRRQDPHPRVRLRHRDADHGQSLEPRSHPGRLERRLGRQRRGPRLLHGAGLGHRRLDPHPGRALRHGRPQADLRAGQQGGRRLALLVARPCRPADPDRARRGADAAVPRRLRPARSRLGRRARRRLRGRARGGRQGPAHRRAAELFLRARRRAGRDARARPRSMRWPGPARRWSRSRSRSPRRSWRSSSASACPKPAPITARCCASAPISTRRTSAPSSQAGELVPATDYITALRVRQKMKQAWAAMFARIDVLIGPAVAAPATRRDQDSVRWADGTVEPVTPVFVRLSAPANVTGLPVDRGALRLHRRPAASRLSGHRPAVRRGDDPQGRPCLRGADRLDQPGAADLRRRTQPWLSPRRA